MALIRKIPVVWGGFPGSPGVSVFYSPEATDANASIKTFFTSCQAHAPAGVTWTIPFAGDTINDSNGDISGTWTSVDGGTVTSTGTGAYAAGTGAFVRWLTGGIVAGRRVKGHTFFCPIIASDYDSTGTILTGALTVLQSAAAVLGGASKLVIWARESPGTSAHPGARAGSSHPVIAGTVPDLVTSLRSRRS